MEPRTALSTNVIFKIPAPAHDAYLVCVAYGDGVKDASWKTMADFTLAVTNPIFIDADRDGKYMSSRETALALLGKIQPLTLASVEKSLEVVDSAVGTQLLSEAKLRLPAEELGGFERFVEKLAKKDSGYELYRIALMPPMAPLTNSAVKTPKSATP
jgi:hypothetical protein